jgi:zinc protease
LDKIEMIIEEEIQKIKKDGITENELQKAVNNVKSEFYGQLQTIAGKANAIGIAEVFYGDYNEVFKLVDHYKNISLKQIQDAANKYFISNYKTVGKLIPEGGVK